MSIRTPKKFAFLLAVILMLTAATALASPTDYDKSAPQNLSEDYLYGEAAVVMDGQSGEILFSKNSRVRMYPASTTKIMTLLLAVESGISFDTPVTIPPEAGNIPGDSSLIPIYAGETTTFGDLLYGMMLHSGNDGANAVAVLLEGSLDNFVRRMNERAEELGCTGTHFMNAHGYHDENHYSTAQDLALIAAEALKYDAARTIMATPSYTMNVSPRGEIKLSNTNILLREDSGYYYEDCIGVKTGSHSRAGQCFVGAAEKDGVTLVSVTLKCTESNQKWTDTIRLFNYGFTCYTPYTLEQMFQMIASRLATVRISNAAEDDPQGGQLTLNIAQVSNSEYERMIQTDSDTAMSRALDDFISRSVLNITSDLVAPISAGEILGSFSYTTQDGEAMTAALIASRDIEAQPETTTIYDVFPFLGLFDNLLVRLLLVVVALLILSIALYRAARRRRIERRRRELYERRRREYMNRERRRSASQSRTSSHSAPVRRPSTRIPPRTAARPQGRSAVVRRKNDDDDLFRTD